MRLAVAWEPWRDGMVKAAVPDADAYDQLFVDGVRQPLARYPNAGAHGQPFDGCAADAFSEQRAARWRDPAGGFMHAIHSSEWGGYSYRITGKGADGKLACEGGWQNNRQMGMHDRYRMVENIFEELDAPGEWFHDPKAKVLYYDPAPGVAPATAVVEGVRLRHLIEWRGEAGRPVHHVSCTGFTFRHAQRTFMEAREPLLRSDWRVYRGGALFLTAAEDCGVHDCVLDQLGGNAVFVSGHARRIAVTGCRIEQPGATGVAFVGDPKAVRSPLFTYDQSLPVDRLDPAPGPQSDDYPADCLVDDCLIHASGRFEKQSAGIEIGMAARITIRDCTICEVPRAGINIGDGGWGGHLIEGCDVYDTVLETGDHGSFNSWGRDRYWVPDTNEINRRVAARPELPGLDAVETTTLRTSRWRCDHGWDIDLDDGSSNYHIVGNLCLGGGIKLREGYRRVVENNIMVGNSLHAHVWLVPSHDIVRHNIVFTPYRPIAMPKPWGDVCDGNLLHVPGQAAPTPATALRDASGRDETSLAGDARFVAPQSGDWRVAKDSPAVALGFVGFATDRYGVRSPRLRALTRGPRPPAGPGAAGGAAFRDEAPGTWLGAHIKNLCGLDEISATGMPGETGVLLTEVAPGGALARAGARPLDVVREVDGAPVTSVHDLLRACAAAPGPGRRHALGLWRNQQITTATIDGGRCVLLSAGAASFQGPGAKPSFDAAKDFLGSWSDPGVAVAWEAALDAGTYDVALLSAAPGSEAGSTIGVTVADQHLQGAVPATAGWESFTATTLGSVAIARSGPQAIVLRALTRRGGAVMNLRALVFSRR
jgi:hypothetical protein